MIYQKANESDHGIHERYRKSNLQRNLIPGSIYADSNYMSGEEIYIYHLNDQLLMGRINLDTSKKHKDFKTHNFQIDMEKKIAVCPKGKKSDRYSIQKNGYIYIFFSKKDCKACPDFNKCVVNARGGKRRIMINQYYNWIQERRIEQETEEFKKEMRVRAQVEGTISEMVRKSGFRFAKYKGEDGHQLQFYLTGAALNVKRMIRAITKGMDIKQAA